MKNTFLLITLMALAPSAFAQVSANTCAGQKAKSVEKIARLTCKVSVSKLDTSDLDDEYPDTMEVYFNESDSLGGKYGGCNRSAASDKYTLVASRNAANGIYPATVDLSILKTANLDSSKDVYQQSAKPMASLQITGTTELTVPNVENGTQLHVYCEITSKYALGE